MRIHLLFTFALALMLNAVPLPAQDLAADVPFDFQVGKRTLPSGEYVIEIDNAGMVWIKGRQPGIRAVAGSFGIGGAGFGHESKLVFNRYGSRYFLSQVWDATSSTGRELPKTRTEDQMAKQIESSPTTLLALQR